MKPSVQQETAEIAEGCGSLFCSRNGSAMLMAVTAFPVIDPKLMAMVLLAVPVPVVVWLALAKCFALWADKTGVKAAT